MKNQTLYQVLYGLYSSFMTSLSLMQHFQKVEIKEIQLRNNMSFDQGHMQGVG